MFSTSLFSPYFSFPFFVFFSFHSLKLWRIFNTHVNQPVKLLSPPVLVDSTRFSLYAIMEVSRKPKHTHFKYQFQNIHFCARFSPDHPTISLFDDDKTHELFEINEKKRLESPLKLCLSIKFRHLWLKDISILKQVICIYA